jgi:hypothetical protein
MVTRISWTVWPRLIDRASARGAASKNSSETSWGATGCPSMRRRSQSTSDRTPAWATSMTQARWSAGSSRNQGSVSSMRATLAVASAPAARSIVRTVASSTTGSTPPSIDMPSAFHALE